MSKFVKVRSDNSADCVYLNIEQVATVGSVTAKNEAKVVLSSGAYYMVNWDDISAYVSGGKS